jgi:putative tricarboxylic transport membrane protein
MAIHNKSELLAATVLAGFGGFIIYEACGLPYSSEFGPGPGFFPLWIGIGILTCALAMICTCALGAEPREAGTGKFDRSDLSRALGAWLAFALAIALLSFLGFGLSLGVLTVFLIVVLDRRPSWVALGVAAGLVLGFHLVFAVALGVSLPEGPLGF